MEQMFTPTNRIGVYPDGSPVVYSPEKAAEKRKEIAERIKAQLEAQGKDASNLRVSFAPELEPENNIDRIPPLERSPETDEVMLFASKPDMICAKVTPKDVIAWGEAFAFIAGLAEKYGPMVYDFFSDLFGSKPKTPEQVAMKAMVMNSIAESENMQKDEQPVLTMDDVTRFQEMHYDKPYFN